MNTWQRSFEKKKRKGNERGGGKLVMQNLAFEDLEKKIRSLVFLVIRSNDYRDIKSCRLGFQSKRKGFTTRRSASPARTISYFLL